MFAVTDTDQPRTSGLNIGSNASVTNDDQSGLVNLSGPCSSRGGRGSRGRGGRGRGGSCGGDNRCGNDCQSGHTNQTQSSITITVVPKRGRERPRKIS